MGPSITIMFIDADETVELLPFVQYEKLLRRDIDYKISKYAGMRIRYVPVAVELQTKIEKAIILPHIFVIISPRKGDLDP